MPRSESLEPLPPPTRAMWSSIDIVVDRELHGGHQSRVFLAVRNSDDVVVKLVDSRVVDGAFHRRVALTSRLSAANDSVIGPIPAHDDLISELGGWLAVIYPYVEGRPPDIGVESDVRWMAEQMAALHRSLNTLDQVDLPEVAALVGTDWGADGSGFGHPQLLHGDFSRKNLLLSARGNRVFDFDDCGYGPIEFEVGNTLYMELFDAAMSSEVDRYEQFRSWFVDEYRLVSGCDVADELIDRSVGLRVSALGRWVERPETAPVGSRTAAPAWRESLARFVQEQAKR